MHTASPDEAARLREVERYRRSGALTGEKLERVVKLASAIFGFEHVNITTHYEEMQICHVRVGNLGRDRPRADTFCRVPVETLQTLVVHDLAEDERFWSSPLVVEGPCVRFYAGAPLISPSGQCIGALCLLDTKPREFSARDAELLTDLATLAVEHMELIRVNEEAKYDPLTGLRNRPYLLDAMQASIDAGRMSSVVLVDLDGFKEINDSLGHACGDEALVLVAERLAEFAGDDRVIARLGGNEFVIFVDGKADPLAAAELAAALVARLGEPITLHGHVVHFGASVGSALRSNETQATQLLANADLAMYRAKQDGRNCHRLFTREMRDTALERGNVVLRMQKAWEDGAFEIYYQPIVRLSDGAWTGAEALLRWIDPSRGVLRPALFLPILEKSHLAEDVGRWVIEEACRQASVWRRRFEPDFKIAVNLFELQFKSGTLVPEVRDVLARNELPPQALQLELTERVILADDPTILEQVQQLREIGVGIALDDFGTGFASLSALKNYPVSCIKIDRSFIAEAADNPADLSIVSSFINLSRSLDLETVAEGIETSAQLAAIGQEKGLNGQGYLFSRPQPAKQLELRWAAERDAAPQRRRA